MQASDETPSIVDPRELIDHGSDKFVMDVGMTGRVIARRERPAGQRYVCTKKVTRTLNTTPSSLDT